MKKTCGNCKWLEMINGRYGRRGNKGACFGFLPTIIQKNYSCDPNSCRPVVSIRDKSCAQWGFNFRTILKKRNK